MPQLNAQQWLARLVAFDTTSCHSNLALIHCLEDYFRELSLPYWLSHSADGNKANIFATLPASNGETQGGIVLSGHTDVVPVDGQVWTHEPFVLTEHDGRLYGRGTCDMKGFIASALAMIPEIMQENRAKPIHFAFSYDEEVGCVGAPVMLEALQQRGQKIDGCIVGEPTSMKVVVAHKGINVFQCDVHGKAAHSSLTPQGCNAIEYAAELICQIRQLANAYRQNGPFDDKFDVPFTSMTTNLIQGGIAVNTIPEFCRLHYEFRNLPGMSADKIQQEIEDYIQHILLPKMRQEHADADIQISKMAAAPSLEAAEQAAITELVRALNQDHEIRKVAYGTEAGLFERAGIPTIVCGPGNIEQAHKADEFISLEQLNECDRFLRKLVRSL
ncbi:MAG: acetylornithine deacetylase [Neisseria sp.]|nr:acetylornithine deacetylase [Neisseria sp.]